MLHRVIAALLCALGLVAIGLAVASATVWRPADALVASATAEPGHPLVATDAGVLDLAAEEVRLVAEVDGDGPVVLAVARTADVEAWVGSDPHTRLTGLLDRETLRTEARTGEDVPGEGTADLPADEDAPDPTEGADAGDGAAPEGAAPEDAEDATAPEDADTDAPAAPVADPRGSDLWVLELTRDGSVALDWTDVPGRWSVLVAAPETDEPPRVTMTWPQEVRTPFLVPGVVLGVVLLVLGLAVVALAVVRARSERAVVAPVPDDAPRVRDVAGATVVVGALTRRELRERERRGGTGQVPVVTVTGPAGLRGGGATEQRGGPAGADAGPGHDPSGPGGTGRAEHPDGTGGGDAAAPGTTSNAASSWRRTWGLGAAPPVVGTTDGGPPSERDDAVSAERVDEPDEREEGR